MGMQKRELAEWCPGAVLRLIVLPGMWFIHDELSATAAPEEPVLRNGVCCFLGVVGISVGDNIHAGSWNLCCCDRG